MRENIAHSERLDQLVAEVEALRFEVGATAFIG
jgi:hypothetical protein